MNKNFNEMSFDELKMLPQGRSMEIFGLFTGYCFGDYGHGPDGSEPCFSVQSEIVFELLV